jgi:hypothetical protein
LIDTKSGGTKNPNAKNGKNADTLRKEALQKEENTLTNSLNKQLVMNDYTENEILAVKINYAGKKIKIEEKYKGDVQKAIVEQLELEKQLNENLYQDKIKRVKDESEFVLNTNEYTETGKLKVQQASVDEQLRLAKLRYGSEGKFYTDLENQQEEIDQKLALSRAKEDIDLAKPQQDMETRIQQAKLDKEDEILGQLYDMQKNYYDNIGQLAGENLKGLMKGTESWGDFTKNVIIGVMQQEMQLLITQSLLGLNNSGDKGLRQAGSMLGTFAKAFLFDDGGIVQGASSEHLMTIQQGGEMNLNHAQQKNLFDIVNGKAKGGGGQPVLINNNFNIKTLDGRQAADVILEKKSLIQQIVNEGIRQNNNGLRDSIKAT